MRNLFKKLLDWLFGAASLSAENILACVDLPMEKVDVPEWRGHIFLRGLAVETRIQYLAKVTGALAKDGQSVEEANQKYFDAQIFLLTKSIANEKGQLVFNEAHMVSLSKKSPAIISRLCDKLLLLNGFHVEAVEDHAKN